MNFKSRYKLLLSIFSTSFGVEKLSPRIHEFILLSRINICELFSISFGVGKLLPRIHEFILNVIIRKFFLLPSHSGEGLGVRLITNSRIYFKLLFSYTLNCFLQNLRLKLIGFLKFLNSLMLEL